MIEAFEYQASLVEEMAWLGFQCAYNGCCSTAPFTQCFSMVRWIGTDHCLPYLILITWKPAGWVISFFSILSRFTALRAFSPLISYVTGSHFCLRPLALWWAPHCQWCCGFSFHPSRSDTWTCPEVRYLKILNEQNRLSLPLKRSGIQHHPLSRFGSPISKQYLM